MAQSRGISPESHDSDPRYYAIITQMIRSQGYRELAAATVFAAALRLVPTVAFKKKISRHIEEELEHYEVCCKLYREIGGEGDLDEICSRKVAADDSPIPAVESFVELGVAQFLYYRASAFQLREYENSSFDPYCRVVGKILEEEEGHESFGAEVMIEHCKDPAHLPETQRCFDKWLAVSLRSFGRPNTEPNRYAISVGLKTRDSSAVAQEYIDTLKTVVRVCGLTLPDATRLAELGTETAPGTDFSL